jgi:hypothetical protein
MEIDKDRMDFHNFLLSKLRNNPVDHLPQNQSVRAIPTLVFGKTNAHLWTGLGKKHQRIEVGLMLQGPKAEDIFLRLEQRKQKIDIELRSPVWRERSRCSIMQKRGCDPFDRSLWNDHTDWMILWLGKFVNVFRWELRA